MDESTSIPMPSASPPRDMMLRLTPKRLSGAKVTRIEIGIEMAMIAVDRTLRRKRKSTMTASRPPKTAALRTSLMLSWMKTDRSATRVRRTPSER